MHEHRIQCFGKQYASPERWWTYYRWHRLIRLAVCIMCVAVVVRGLVAAIRRVQSLRPLTVSAKLRPYHLSTIAPQPFTSSAPLVGRSQYDSCIASPVGPVLYTCAICADLRT